MCRVSGFNRLAGRRGAGAAVDVSRGGDGLKSLSGRDGLAARVRKRADQAWHAVPASLRPTRYPSRALVALIGVTAVAWVVVSVKYHEALRIMEQRAVERAAAAEAAENAS